MVDADHYVGSTLTNSFVEKDISYDKNTNLLTLKRYNNGTLTDDLSFSYLGNRRMGYNCDLNGNITNDATENLQVSYNFLNLPTAISQNSEVKARYSYAADSTKLGVVDASGVGYDYRGSFKYIRNGSSIELESVASAGGRTYKTDSGYEVRYFITDHLGSVRAVVNADGEVVEQNDYMPYGTLHANSALQKTDNRYLYGGKELQTDFGVNYYDSFARFQRTDGAFNSIDPKAENYFHISPYAYCAGNPINTVDVDGRVIETAIDVGFVLYDVGAAIVQHIRGNHQKAKQHWKDAGYDTAAAIVPGMPAGTSKVVRAVSRHADEINDGIKVVDKVVDGAKNTAKPYAKHRPKYAKGQVEQVWENAKDPDGLVRDPYTEEVLTWDKSKHRSWDMGHIEGEEYYKMHKRYMDGEISKDVFLKWYKDPANYRPQSQASNRSHKYEQR